MVIVIGRAETFDYSKVAQYVIVDCKNAREKLSIHLRSFSILYGYT